MEPNESSGLSSYFHPHHPQPTQPQQPSPLNHAATAGSPNNGLLPATAPATAASAPMAYSSHAVPSTVSSGALVESVKRKRGRPRKYNTPGEAAAAKRLASAISPPQKKKDLAFSGGSAAAAASSKKFQLASMGYSGQSFTPHVISVTAGEDVHQKIMLFMNQSKRELCILSASGSISNASLLQPATSGGSITYEGRFDILSLCGSYVRTELGGRSGGLSICLSSTDGQIIGGGVGGPLMAAGPVQVIVGTFVIDPKKDANGGRGEASAGKSPPPVGGASNSGVSMWSHMDSSYPTSMGGSQFVIQSGPQSQSQSHGELGNTFTVDGMEGGSSHSDYASVFPKWNQRATHSKLDDDS